MSEPRQFRVIPEPIEYDASRFIGWVPPPAGSAPGHTHRWQGALVPGCRGCAREYARFVQPGTCYPPGWKGTAQAQYGRR
jgi:hypothetical protein